MAGYVFIAAGGAITWRSKRQMLTTLSTTDAEYVALSEAARSAHWLRNLHKELGFKQKLPTTLKVITMDQYQWPGTFNSTTAPNTSLFGTTEYEM